MKAEIGTPWESSQCGEMDGHWLAGAVKREFGCAAGPEPGCQSWPRQLIVPSGGVFCPGSMPSHQGSFSGVSATLVKMVLRESAAIALGLVWLFVPGATPKKPFSGLTAQSPPSGPMRIQAMSSPTVQTFHPWSASGETSMARLVLPQALGKAPPI